MFGCSTDLVHIKPSRGMFALILSWFSSLLLPVVGCDSNRAYFCSVHRMFSACRPLQLICISAVNQNNRCTDSTTRLPTRAVLIMFPGGRKRKQDECINTNDEGAVELVAKLPRQRLTRKALQCLDLRTQDQARLYVGVKRWTVNTATPVMCTQM